METVTLVRNAQAGDKEALLSLIMARKQDYYRLAYTYMGNREDAMDAIQDMTVTLFVSIKGLKKTDAFYSWSKTILVNSCHKLLRNRKKLLYTNDISLESQNIQDDLGSMLEQMSLEKHMSMLSAKQQEVLKLRYYLDFDYQAIAELLHIPLGTVKSRISTGLKQLAKSMGGEDLG